MPLSTERRADFPTQLVRGDPSRPVAWRQWFESPGRNDGIAETWAYVNRLSCAPGETLILHGISTARRVDIEVSRESGNAEVVARWSAVAARWMDTVDTASVDGCCWPVLVEVPIVRDWPCGVYRVRLRPTDDVSPEGAAETLFVVHPGESGAAGRLLLVTADSTWLAYNDWGGSNHYEGVVEPDSGRFAPQLSTQRPWARGFVSLPDGAPRTVPQDVPEFDAPVSYPHMEWAWSNGYSKKYASAGWASYERHFLHWAETRGYRPAVMSQQDLHFRPHLLDGAACVVMVGHDEYWSWQMRDAVDDYLDKGGRVARFAGNFLWQVRLEDDGRRQVCHKYRARSEDPQFNSSEPHLTTNCWEAPEIDRPGRATFGLDGSRGMYAGWGGLAPRGAGGFTVYRPDHWALADCRLGYGDLLGARSRVFGYEVDGLAYRIEDGLPWPDVETHLPDDLEILAMGLARMREDGFDGAGSELFVADDDARFVAGLHGDEADAEQLARVDRGSGMVVSFRRGRGEVFHAGTTEWVNGLIRGDRAVEQVTHNVLRRFLAGTA